MAVGSWVLRGVGTVALVMGGGASWAVLTWDDLHVVEATVPQAAGDESMPPAATAPSTSPTTATAATAAPAPAPNTEPNCATANERTQGDPTTDWATVVVDRQRGLPAQYVPPDLVDASAAGFDSGDKVREIVVDDLAAMRQAAADNDTPLALISAYRSYDRQAELFTEAVDDTGQEQAELTTAQAGHSEHQLGTTIDVLGQDSSALDPAFADTPAGRWVLANAHRYGFVVSYPDVPVERSCYGFEPWHLRYVGRDVARQIVDSGLTPREWMLAQVQG